MSGMEQWIAARSVLSEGDAAVANAVRALVGLRSELKALDNLNHDLLAAALMGEAEGEAAIELARARLYEFRARLAGGLDPVLDGLVAMRAGVDGVLGDLIGDWEPGEITEETGEGAGPTHEAE